MLLPLVLLTGAICGGRVACLIVGAAKRLSAVPLQLPLPQADCRKGLTRLQQELIAFSGEVEERLGNPRHMLTILQSPMLVQSKKALMTKVADLRDTRL